jgi:hypothetical protein
MGAMVGSGWMAAGGAVRLRIHLSKKHMTCTMLQLLARQEHMSHIALQLRLSKKQLRREALQLLPKKKHVNFHALRLLFTKKQSICTELQLEFEGKHSLYGNRRSDLRRSEMPLFDLQAKFFLASNHFTTNLLA